MKEIQKSGSRNIDYERLIEDNVLCLEMVGFDSSELAEIFMIVKGSLVGRSVVGTGKKGMIDEKDKLVIFLSYVRQSMTSRSLALEFGFKKAYLSTLIPNIQQRLENFVENIMAEIINNYATNRVHFESFPNCFLATDCSLINHPPPGKLASYDEQKNYFSAKHGRYGYKVLAMISAQGFCIYSSPLFKGSIHDIEMLREVEKDVKKVWIEGTDIMSDSAFIGNLPFSMIVPFKQPIHGVLSREHDEFNLTVARERVLIENFFGRLKVKWPIIEKTA